MVSRLVVAKQAEIQHDTELIPIEISISKDSWCGLCLGIHDADFFSDKVELFRASLRPIQVNEDSCKKNCLLNSANKRKIIAFVLSLNFAKTDVFESYV